MRYAEFLFKQKYHRVTNDYVAPQIYFCVKMPFDEGLSWVLGRKPDTDNSPLYYAIPILNPAVTSVLAKISSILTNYGGIHLIKPLSNKQYLSVGSRLINNEYILKDRDTLTISSLPLEFQYKIVEISNNTKPEDDTLSFMPDAKT